AAAAATARYGSLVSREGRGSERQPRETLGWQGGKEEHEGAERERKEVRERSKELSCKAENKTVQNKPKARERVRGKERENKIVRIQREKVRNGRERGLE